MDAVIFSNFLQAAKKRAGKVTKLPVDESGSDNTGLGSRKCGKHRRSARDEKEDFLQNLLYDDVYLVIMKSCKIQILC